MALPMLVGGGAECGPSNPLQGLSKRFDQDRGIQQDHFGAGRLGSTKELFRSQQSVTQDQDAAQFFSAAPSVPHFAPESAYDLSAMHTTLPVNQTPQTLVNPLASWATDFVQQQPLHSQELAVTPQSAQVNAPVRPATRLWNPTMSNFQMNPISKFAPQMPIHRIQQHESVVHNTTILWDKEFNALESHLVSPSDFPMEEIAQKKSSQQPDNDGDELARTAAVLLESVKDETNPKFQNSQFLGLMKQLRDGQMVVEGNQMVESDGRTSSKVDVKGKGRAIDHVFHPTLDTQDSGLGSQSNFLDANDSYFQQENADYIRYWNDLQDQPQRPTEEESLSWDSLQDDWDKFEATATGIKTIKHYQFQENNPHLLGDSTATRQHLVHTSFHRSSENLLELEAAVQRNMENASAWFELGVKQQENEHEYKALQALEHAVELDPSHLPAWLALAISHANDSNRRGTYDAIYNWVCRNTKYENAFQQYFATNATSMSSSPAEKNSQLIQCLITIARSNVSGEIDADIQVALAVLLNTNEEYEKAQDCFKAALAVRPGDWSLYNRVGATLANSNHPEEALEYYYRALEIKPGYIRARFNLGISCLNLKRYDEAAQYILQALFLQDNEDDRGTMTLNEKRGTASSSLWETLKSTCLQMQRPDLIALCESKDLEGLRVQFFPLESPMEVE